MRYIGIFIIIFFFSIINLHAESIDKTMNSNQLFFDNLIKSPSYTGDSTYWNTMILEGWGGYYGSLGHASVDKYFDCVKSGFGIRFDFNGKFNQSYGFLYSYKYKIGALDWNIGAGIGVLRHLESRNNLFVSYSNKSDYKNLLNLSIGSSLSFKKHTIGISYNRNPLSPVLIDSIAESQIFLNYKTNIRISNSIAIFPEIFDVFSFNANDCAFSLKMSFYGKLIIGYIYNTSKHSSYMVSFQICQKIELGASLDYYSKMKIYGFMFNIKI